MSKRYIHISSSHRDRTQYPLQSSFDVILSNRGQSTDPNVAKDPVISSYPILAFTYAFMTTPYVKNLPFGILGPPPSAGTVFEPIIQNVPSPLPFPFPFPFEVGDDFFCGMNITADMTVAFGPSQPFVSTITSYKQLTHSISINPPFPTKADTTVPIPLYFWVSSTSTYTISLPLYMDSSHILIPYGNPNDEAYRGFILEDLIIGESRTITHYDGTTFMATLDSAFGGGWALTDSYLLRETAPYVMRQIVGGTGNYIYNGVSYTYVIPLGGGMSNIEDTYNNMYFFNNNNYISGIADHSLIVKYFGNSLPFPFSNLILLKTPITINAFDFFDILPFTRDNATPLIYFGSEPQEMCCYSIELISLILPNVTLSTTGIGGRVINVPYVYVEFYKMNESSHNLIYSNNPNSKNAVFLVILDDYPQTFSSPYVRVDGGMQKQIIKFKPNDSLSFRVVMPNGELFSTQTEDDLSPLPPNNSLQIELLVAIEKI